MGIGVANVNTLTSVFCSRNSNMNRAKSTTIAADPRATWAHQTMRCRSPVGWAEPAAGMGAAPRLPADERGAPGHTGADARQQDEIATSQPAVLGRLGEADRDGRGRG